MNTKKPLLIMGLMCLLSAGCTRFTAEGQFKQLCENYKAELTEFYKNIQAKDTKKMHSAKQTFMRELKTFYAKNPESIWADDASFVFAYLLRTEDMSRQTKIKEIQSLFTRYPDFHIEDWTRENIPPIVTASDLSFPPANAPQNISVDIHCQRLLKLYLYFQYRPGEEKEQWILCKEIIETPEYDYGHIDASTDACKKFYMEFRKEEWKKRQAKQKEVTSDVSTAW